MIEAVRVIRFTAASRTPGWRTSARCTRAWQAAHVIPDTGISMRTTGASLASSRAVTLLSPGPIRTIGGDEEVPVHPANRGDGRNDDHNFVGAHVGQALACEA
jgi:hypothetical protein